LTRHAAAVIAAMDSYARGVVDGTIPAGRYHRLAAVRHLRDRRRARDRDPDFPYWLDGEAAARFVRFAERLKHYKGAWAGTLIVLQPHQLFRLGSLFGWKHRVSGLRRFRTAYNEIPRKNGKSLEAAVVALYVTFFDGERGAEGYCAATKREQSKIVFRDARRLIISSGLRRYVQPLAHSLFREDIAAKLEPLGADYNSTDGLNPNLIILDEFHALLDRGIVDVLETATGSRLQPVMFQITTAGTNLLSPCGDQHEYACKILDGDVEDETFFTFIAHADIGDDWREPATWIKANPNYGVSVYEADFAAQVTKARAQPSAVAAFQQKRCNLWVSAATPWLSMEGWRAGQSPVPWPPDYLDGQPCWAGVDLSSKTDLTAIVLAFPPEGTRARWCYLGIGLTPDETVTDRALRDRVPYAQWIAAGVLRTNPGKRIEHAAVRDILVELGERYDIQEVGIDPWNAGNLPNDLEADDFVVTEVPQNVAQISQAAKEFEADVLDGLVDTNSNPLMAHHAANVIVLRDSKDNLFPTKKKSRGRIDLMVAAIIARKMAGLPADAEPVSAYADHGVEVV
jgi:phage terminase large subunit-like protein